MKYRPFGSLKFNVSEIGFGGAALSGEGGGYGFGSISEDDSIVLAREAFDRGINLFDTAPIYGYGLSEIRLGKAFKNQRDKVFLVSKSGVTWHADTKRVNLTNDPSVAQKMLEQSLKDLATDYLDLYMIHWPDSAVDIRRPMEVLVRAQREGKIKSIGLCNTHLIDLNLAQEIGHIDVVQSEFSYLKPQVMTELFPALVKDNIGFMSWGTFDKGILTGRVTKEREFEKVDARSWAPWWKQSPLESKLAKVKAITPLVKNAGLSLRQFALGYNLQNPEVSTCLVGARSLDQLETLITDYEKLENYDAINKVISQDKDKL
jgi:myo-inositol catabolism protein IolS